MTLYDSILLLRAHWRRLVTLPTLAVAMTAVILALTPRADEARTLLRVETHPGRLVAVLNSRRLAQRLGVWRLSATTRRDDPQLIEVVGQDVAVLWAAILGLDDAERERRRDVEQRIGRLLTERAALALSVDEARKTDYDSLTRRIDALRVTPPTVTGALEIIDPPLQVRHPRVRPAPLVAAGTAALVVTGLGLFVAAWWRAEGEARRRVPSEPEPAP